MFSDFVTFPNGVFSGVIISSVVHNSDIKSTAEWQLLLTTLALPGVFIGAALCNPLGRKQTMMLGRYFYCFGTYLLLRNKALIYGQSYKQDSVVI